MSDARTADRLAIGELFARYAFSILDRDWSAWRGCFTPNGTADYTTAGGVAGTADEAAAWLEPTLSMFDVTVSQVGNAVIDFTGDTTADVRSMYKMVMRIPGDQPVYLEGCGWYADRVERTDRGWLIAHRFEHLLYVR
ncbi:MAG: nuclear transport factor 2 family protein [Actinomycetota bacterium]